MIMDDIEKPSRSLQDLEEKSLSYHDTVLISPLSSDFSPTSSDQVQNDSSSYAEEVITLPSKLRPRLLRHIRYTFYNVYRRLFSIVFAANTIGIIVYFTQSSGHPASISNLATAASANILVALLIRQDYVINTLFKLCWLVPLSAPLRIRRMLAKVYEYGGVHSGAAVSSTIWFIILTAVLTQEFVSGYSQDPAVMTFTYVLLFLLLAMIVTAYPKVRFMSHNTFETVHRWAGWFCLALFWVELGLFAHQLQRSSPTQSLGAIIIAFPAFWFLLIASIHCILPWLRLHQMRVQAEHLSDHAIRLRFTEKVPLFVGLRISRSPLKEWHSFACIPERNGAGGSVLISNAGDWTLNTIDNPAEYYYIKGIPVTGVLCMAQIFQRVVIVTTGSGIGPCLGVILDIPKTRTRLLWSTPSPWATYGEKICNSVLKVDPQAVIIDTRKRKGRPGLVKLAYQLYIEADAEAVFCISNPKLTRKVVYGLESRGVPAFGPIWDS